MVKFKDAVANLHKAVVEFSLGSSEEEAAQKIVEDHVPLERATAVSSRVMGLATDTELYKSPNLHKPVIDLDVPHCYVSSTTEGHGHLIIDKELTWEQYMELLSVLVKCGIVEQGYLNVALMRGESWIRVPWVSKQPEDGISWSKK